MSERHVNGDEEQPSTITEVDALPGATADTASFQRPSSEIDPPDVSMDNPSHADLHTQISASTYLTVLLCETGFDSLAQAVVHGSDDALLEPEPNTFQANEGIAVFDDETRQTLAANETQCYTSRHPLGPPSASGSLLRQPPISCLVCGAWCIRVCVC